MGEASVAVLSEAAKLAETGASVAPAAPATPGDAVADTRSHEEHETGDARVAGLVHPEDAAPPVGASTARSAASVRRGLPRTPGGEPWPPLDFVPIMPAARAVSASSPGGGDVAELETSAAREADAGAVIDRLASPLPFRQTVWPGRYADVRPVRREPRRYGALTAAQWMGAVVVGGLALLFAAAMVVLFTRWLVSTPPVSDFIARYHGQYSLPAGTAEGFPAWVQWQHFFNVFLMVLIIRSGLTVRREKRPAVFWSPRGNKRRRISLTMWFHQALDVLWMLNGAVFIVLLFVTGHWARLVPTSWEVFPHALSAALQYVSLDWPTENGWVNYNALQQLAYFTTVFIAAPLAIITGVRMSGFWTKRLDRFSGVYPVEWARAVHFPVMLYFVLFIIVHVTLVLATGALRNLNHMYGGVDVVNWAGFWIFFASLVVIVIGWIAARPLVLVPIAKLFGTVKGR